MHCSSVLLPVPLGPVATTSCGSTANEMPFSTSTLPKIYGRFQSAPMGRSFMLALFGHSRDGFPPSDTYNINRWLRSTLCSTRVSRKTIVR
jgi:hypothetical protein